MPNFFEDELELFLEQLSVEKVVEDDNNMVVFDCNLSDEMAAIEAAVEAELQQELLDECGLDKDDFDRAA